MLDRFKRAEPATFSIANVNDRRFGRNYPLFRTEQELAALRFASRILCGTNSYAIGLQEGLTSYVIGDGYKYRAVCDDKPIAIAVQKVIDEFLEINEWCGGGQQRSLEEELFQRGEEDGEYFLLHFCQDDGTTLVRTTEPEQISESVTSNYDAMQRYFGIATEEDDTQTVLAYLTYFGQDPSDGEEIEPARMVHFKNNVKRSIKRGMPSYTFDAYDALALSSKMRHALGVGGTIQASIPGIREHQAVTKGEVEDFTASIAQTTEIDPLTAQERNVQKVNAGDWLDVPQSVKYIQPPGYANAEAFISILHAGLRGAGVRWNAPEWLATASGAEMAAYTASLTAESPFIRRVIRAQKGQTGCFKRSQWIALENYCAVRGGVLVRRKGVVIKMDFDDLRRAGLTIQVEAPSPKVRDVMEEAQANQIYVSMGAKDRQTVSMELGLNPDDVIAANEEYQERTGGAFGMAGNPLGVDDTRVAKLMQRQQDKEVATDDENVREWLEVEDSSGHKHGNDGKFSATSGSAHPKPQRSKEERQKIKGDLAKADMTVTHKLDGWSKAVSNDPYGTEAPAKITNQRAAFESAVDDAVHAFGSGSDQNSTKDRIDALQAARVHGVRFLLAASTTDPKAMDVDPKAHADYVGKVRQTVAFVTRAEKVYRNIAKGVTESLDVPDVRQQSTYDCGAAALAACCQSLGVPCDLNQITAGLGSTPTGGTLPDAMVRVAQSLGLRVATDEGLSIEALCNWLDRGRPVILCIQAGTPAENGELTGGHYVVAVGHGNGNVVLQDPVAGKTALNFADLEARWIDRDATGRTYERWGCAVWK
jgi:predicted double-glycine peptidase